MDPDLVVTADRLPDIGGFDLAIRLCADRPVPQVRADREVLAAADVFARLADDSATGRAAQGAPRRDRALATVGHEP